jgi:hypothetical protein
VIEILSEQKSESSITIEETVTVNSAKVIVSDNDYIPVAEMFEEPDTETVNLYPEQPDYAAIGVIPEEQEKILDTVYEEESAA